VYGGVFDIFETRFELMFNALFVQSVFDVGVSLICRFQWVSWFT
jgi:hypothetical protein